MRRLQGVYLSEARLIDADFSAIQFERAAVSSTTFIGCRFRNVTFDARTAGSLVFENCEIEDSVFVVRNERGVVSVAAEYDHCRLRNLLENGDKWAIATNY